MTPMVTLTDLRTDIALRHSTAHPVGGVSLTVGAGESLGIVGESGCGKTMTALSIMRLLPKGGRIAGGSITFGSQDLAGLDEAGMRSIRGNRIGMIFQDPMTSLNPCLTIGDQIAETVLLHRDVTKAQARARAEEVLELVGLPRAKERLDSYPHLLSGGMRQRVVIAMALACEPELLIADEPTTALDATIQRQILDLIDDLRARLGMALILVTHDLGVIAGHTDRVAVMYAGKVVETSSTRELFDDPKHPYTEALFRALPDNVEPDRSLYAIPGLPPDLTDPPPGCRFAPRCGYATDECLLSEPPLTGEDHSFACFHPLDETRQSSPNPTLRRAQPVAAHAEPLLKVEHLVRDFPVTSNGVLHRRIGAVSAVADVSFDVRHGETFGLVGESGCGKSTIARLLVAADTPTSGSITFDGAEITGQSARQLRGRRQDFQLMFQDPYASLDPRMRVRSIIGEPLAIQHRGTRAEQEKQVAELLDEVGLPTSAANRYPHEFSGGQRQRIGLARALALRPKLIVADEPVSALDVSVQAQILNLMRRLQADHQLTYVFISHDLSVVRYLSTRIGVMYLGKLVEIGPTEQVYTTPAHPYTRGLIDTIPGAQDRTVSVRGELPSALHPPSGCRFRTRCPLATDLCATEEPTMREFSPEGHRAACHHPLT
ncbi:ABC transporter ATP-binding protein [Pseudonocardia spinosispora]|uniref:ABC transporter ATP-binding protein n=1 Tax=Pseudonocardia spinosispora TaxID=103441 RepID=UPI0003FD20E5|nr:ABC transporter ATP-binding protein [Pseudonocardia spinosispora]